MIAAGLIINLAFLFTDNKKMDVVMPKACPTYRVKVEVYPHTGKNITMSAGLSKVNDFGMVNPKAVYKVKLLDTGNVQR